MSDPFVAFGADEIRDAPKLGDTIECRICGGQHTVVPGTVSPHGGAEEGPDLLSFFRCRGELYLAGIRGKDVRR